jgi:hypothetical protein
VRFSLAPYNPANHVQSSAPGIAGRPFSTHTPRFLAGSSSSAEVPDTQLTLPRRPLSASTKGARSVTPTSHNKISSSLLTPSTARALRDTVKFTGRTQIKNQPPQRLSPTSSQSSLSHNFSTPNPAKNTSVVQVCHPPSLPAKEDEKPLVDMLLNPSQASNDYFGPEPGKKEPKSVAPKRLTGTLGRSLAGYAPPSDRKANRQDCIEQEKFRKEQEEIRKAQEEKGGYDKEFQNFASYVGSVQASDVDRIGDFYKKSDFYKQRK